MAQIRHLAILTENVERLVKFYTEAFGMKVVEGVGTATYVSDGQINLAIIPIGPEGRVEGRTLKAGLFHFGFEVEDVDASTVSLPRAWCRDGDPEETGEPRSRIPGSRPGWQSH